MEWESVREGRVPVARHAELAALLRAAYPHFPEHFTGARSWSYLRPELRVIGSVDRAPTATAGVLRRFVEVGGRDVPVAIVGLVAVHPDAQGGGRGLALLDRVGQALRELAVPFGVLMCSPALVPFYGRAGWRPVSSRRVRYLADDTTEPTAVIDERADELLLLPVGAATADWPDGDVDWHCASV